MTDRAHTLTVVLDQDIRTDDVQDIVEAIKMLRHVANVGVNVVDSGDYAARQRVLADIREDLMNLFSKWSGLDP